MMKPEVKTMFIKALRSGEFKQAKGQLRTNKDGFCCLGLLCNLHAETHPNSQYNRSNPEVYGGKRDKPPKQVLGWAGLNEYDVEDLIMMNDEEEKSFKQIANFVEGKL